MIDTKKIEEAKEQYFKNPYWKKVYEGAPSDNCRKYIEFEFCSSKYYEPDGEDAEDFDKMQSGVESTLNAEDWEYLKILAPNSPFVGYCDKKIKELSDK